jgi:hypothetical protein
MKARTSLISRGRLPTGRERELLMCQVRQCTSLRSVLTDESLAKSLHVPGFDADGAHAVFNQSAIQLLNRRQLADQASALRTGLTIVYTSGYTDNAIFHRGQLDPGNQSSQQAFIGRAVWL